MPHGSDLFATPRVDGVSVCPHAVRLPKKPGPYQDASAYRYAVILPPESFEPVASLLPFAWAFTS